MVRTSRASRRTDRASLRREASPRKAALDEEQRRRHREPGQDVEESEVARLSDRAMRMQRERPRRAGREPGGEGAREREGGAALEEERRRARRQRVEHDRARAAKTRLPESAAPIGEEPGASRDDRGRSDARRSERRPAPATPRRERSPAPGEDRACEKRCDPDLQGGRGEIPARHQEGTGGADAERDTA